MTLTTSSPSFGQQHPNPERMQKLANITERYDQKAITLEEARAEMKALAPIAPWEIAYLEQVNTDNDKVGEECHRRPLGEMIAIFAPYLDRSRPTGLAFDHPIAVYYREIDAWKGLIKEIEDLVQYPVIRNQWYGLYDRLAELKIHFARKHNQLYSELERRGFNRPSTHMWLFDDYIRDEIRDARTVLERETPASDDEFIARQKNIIDNCLDLIAKEETILLPTSLALIPPAAFEHMKLGDQEIGFAWGAGTKAAPEVNVTAQSAAPQLPADMANFANDFNALMQKYGLQAGGKTGDADGLLEVKTGRLSLDQINLIFQHLPIDISFVDEEEIVRFYTDTKHRIFPRSRNVIGRKVTNCHPATSVHFVKEIVKRFKSGEEDKVDFWINKPGKFIYILFVAIRDEAGNFRGVMEVMQDCTRIRELQDSRTLLTWSQETTEPVYLHGIAEPGENVPVGKRAGLSSKQEAPSSESVEKAPMSVIELPELTPETKLKDLIEIAPWLRQRLGDEVMVFKALRTPLGDIMIPKATLALMSEHGGVEMEKLKDIIRRLVALGPKED